MMDGKTIADWQREAWTIAEDKGFHDGLPCDRHGTLVRLCLIHTEISEAAQLVKRHGLGAMNADVGHELADTCIRLFELAYMLDIDLELAIETKMALNRKRPYKYGTPDESR